MKDVAFLWLGQDLPWFNRVAIRSFLECGHTIHLFCEPSLRASLKEFSTQDYREIIDEKTIMALGSNRRSASDIFRLLLLRDTDYIWVDCDCLALKPMPDGDIILAKSQPESDVVNNNVLRMPRDSKELSCAIDIVLNPDFIPPWVSARRSRKAREISGWDRRNLLLSREATFGPDLINHVLNGSILIESAYSYDCFNPIGVKEGYKLFSKDFGLSDVSTSDSYLVHFYQSNIRPYFYRNGPNAGTILGDLAYKFRIGL